MAPYYFCEQAGHGPWTVILHALFIGAVVGTVQYHADVAPRKARIEELCEHIKGLQATIDNREVSLDQEERLREAEGDLEMIQEENAILREQLRTHNDELHGTIQRATAQRLEIERHLREEVANLEHAQKENTNLLNENNRLKKDANISNVVILFYSATIIGLMLLISTHEKFSNSAY